MSKTELCKNIWKEISEDIYPALINTNRERLYGYINTRGDFLIEPRFTQADFFNDKGFAVVMENDKFGLINKNGRYKLNPIYDSIGEFKEGRAVTQKDGNYGLIDLVGNEIKIKSYSFVSSFSEGRALVSTTDKDYNSKYGYIDLNGKEIVEPKYSQAYDYRDTLAVVKEEEDVYNLLNLEGKVVKTLNYNFIGRIGDGLLAFKKEPYGLIGYIDIEGNEVIEPRYKWAEEFENGVAVVSRSYEYNGPYGIVNKNGEEVYKEIFRSILNLGENRVALGMPLQDEDIIGRSIYAIGTTTGEQLTAFKYRGVGRYQEGYAYAGDYENIFFINITGEREKSLPCIKGSGELKKLNKLIYANVDYMPYYLRENGKIVYESNKKIYIDNKYSVLIEKYSPNVSYLIYYPKISGMDNKKKQIEINKYLYTESYFIPYGEDGNEGKAPTVTDVLNYSYYGNFEVQYNKNNILVLKLTGYYYPLGAAHGMPSMKTPTINLQTGEIYKLSDLFMGGVYWVGELNRIIEDMIKNGPQKELVFQEAFKGINEEQSFYVDDENLYIYFAPYEIGPYAAGFITFKIPLDSMIAMTNKNGSLYKALTEK